MFLTGLCPFDARSKGQPEAILNRTSCNYRAVNDLVKKAVEAKKAASKKKSKKKP